MSKPSRKRRLSSMNKNRKRSILSTTHTISEEERQRDEIKIKQAMHVWGLEIGDRK